MKKDKKEFAEWDFPLKQSSPKYYHKEMACFFSDPLLQSLHSEYFSSPTSKNWDMCQGEIF